MNLNNLSTKQTIAACVVIVIVTVLFTIVICKFFVFSPVTTTSTVRHLTNEVVRLKDLNASLSNQLNVARAVRPMVLATITNTMVITNVMDITNVIPVTITNETLITNKVFIISTNYVWATNLVNVTNTFPSIPAPTSATAVSSTNLAPSNVRIGLGGGILYDEEGKGIIGGENIALVNSKKIPVMVRLTDKIGRTATLKVSPGIRLYSLLKNQNYTAEWAPIGVVEFRNKKTFGVFPDPVHSYDGLKEPVHAVVEIF